MGHLVKGTVNPNSASGMVEGPKAPTNSLLQETENINSCCTISYHNNSGNNDDAPCHNFTRNNRRGNLCGEVKKYCYSLVVFTNLVNIPLLQQTTSAMVKNIKSKPRNSKIGIKCELCFIIFPYRICIFLTKIRT